MFTHANEADAVAAAVLAKHSGAVVGHNGSWQEEEGGGWLEEIKRCEFSFKKGVDRSLCLQR
jgi:hypothetical protein